MRFDHVNIGFAVTLLLQRLHPHDMQCSLKRCSNLSLDSVCDIEWNRLCGHPETISDVPAVRREETITNLVKILFYNGVHFPLYIIGMHCIIMNGDNWNGYYDKWLLKMSVPRQCMLLFLQSSLA